MTEAYLKLLELGYFEIGEAFKGLADEHVWKRPSPSLLSVGENAGHLAYWEAVKLAGEGGKPWPDLAKCRVSSALIDPRFRYYTSMIESTPPQDLATMTAAEVYGELMRVHNETVADFRSRSPKLESTVPGWPPNHTYDIFLSYATFHISYHTGQIYSVRHLLGETTVDN